MNFLSSSRKSWLLIVVLVFTLIESAVLVGCRATSADFMARGKKFFEQEQYERALLEFKNAARLEPKNAEPYYQAALAYLALGNGQAAVANLLNAAQIDPKHSGVQLKLTELKAFNQDRAIVQDGEKNAQSLLMAQPRNSEAANALAVAEFRLGETEAALAHFRQALAESPGNFSFAINLAIVELARGDTAGAQSTLGQAEAQNPRNPEPKLALGRLYLVEDRPQDAEREFQRAVTVAPSYSPALIDLAALYMRTGRPADADRTYKTLAALPDRRLKDIHALFLERQNQFDAAISELKTLYEKDRTDRETRTLLVDAYLRTKQAPQAEAIINSALRHNPRDMDALQQRSEIYVLTQRYAEARRDLWQVLHDRPDSAQAHYALARVYHSQNELSEAQELSEALRLDPNLVSARIDLAKVSMLHKGAAASLEVLNQAPPAQQGNLELAIQRNAALLALDRTTELRASLDRSLAIARLPELLLQDALLRIKLHEFDGARKSVREALAKKPGDLTALETLSVTYIAENKKEQGLKAVREEVAQHQSSAPVLVFLGQLLKTNGRRAEARVTFLLAKAKDRLFEPADLALAQLDMEEGQGDDARCLLQKLLSTHERDPIVHLRLGMADELTRYFRDAIEQYRRTLDLDPGNVIALNNLAYLLAERNHEPDEALRWAQKASEAAPDNPTVADTLGWIYFRIGLYGNALQHLEVAARSDLPIAKYHLALACLKAGESDRGKRLLSAVLKAHPQLAKLEEVPGDATVHH